MSSTFRLSFAEREGGSWLGFVGRCVVASATG
jgi:hypothetical protein